MERLLTQVGPCDRPILRIFHQAHRGQFACNYPLFTVAPQRVQRPWETACLLSATRLASDYLPFTAAPPSVRRTGGDGMHADCHTTCSQLPTVYYAPPRVQSPDPIVTAHLGVETIAGAISKRYSTIVSCFRRLPYTNHPPKECGTR